MGRDRAEPSGGGAGTAVRGRAGRQSRPYAPPVPALLPLFPLGTVLFPGLVLPLHVFEERYRELVRDLTALPEHERAFGVVAIREGREVGEDGVRALHEVGTTAQVHRVHAHEDGRYDLVTAGARRFRLLGLRTDRAYLVGEVEWLPDEAGDAGEAAVLAGPVAAALQDYLGALAEAGAGEVAVPELPADPLVLSHLVGATVQVDLADKQALLAADDGRARLRAELSLLRREAGLLRALRLLPAPELVRVAACPN